MVVWRLLLVIGLLLVTSSSGYSATIRVPADQANIKAGVDAAAPGDTVLVAPGVYRGFENKRISFNGKDIVLVSEAGREVTIIDVEGFAEPDQAFRIEHGETAAAVIDGFTIRNGYLETGGGAAILIAGSSPTLRNCTFIDNWMGSAFNDVQGGAAAIENGSPTFTSCSFINNRVHFFGQPPGYGAIGGALYASSSASPIVSDCVFSGNLAIGASINGSFFGGSGGAVAGPCELRRCIFRDNEAKLEGGAVVGGDGLTLIDCGFEGNMSRGDGGALTVFEGATVTRCEFKANVANRSGAVAAGGAEFTDCLFADNVATGPLGAGAIGGGDFLLEGCTFAGNSGVGAGAVSVVGTSVTMNSCTFYGNWATNGPAGLELRQSNSIGAVAHIQGTIFAFSSQGSAVLCDALSSATLFCSDVYGNAGGDWTGCLVGQLGANGNMSADPLFCDPGGRDFTLHASSPCSPPNSPPGCDLVGALPVGCGVTDVLDSPPVDVQRLTVIPNPVRGIARFDLGPAVSVGTLHIFDSQGRLVEQLIGQEGRWEWTPGSSVPAGVYFAVPGAGLKAAESVKFLYLR
jgi:hypothetical protein